MSLPDPQQALSPPEHHRANTTTEDTGTTAYEALAKGLDDLMDACDVVTEKFSEARDEHDRRHR